MESHRPLETIFPGRVVALPKAQVAPAGFLLALEPAILPLPFPTLFASSVTSLLLFQFLEQVKNSRTCEPQDLVCANSLRSDRPESGPQFADMDDDRTHPPPIIADLPIRDSSNRISPLRNLTASRFAHLRLVLSRSSNPVLSSTHPLLTRLHTRYRTVQIRPRRKDDSDFFLRP